MTAAPARPDRTALAGLTWDHPRGHQPLETLERLDEAGTATYGTVPVPLHWERQPLEGFEAEPLDELTERYDVLVVDHPGLGEAVERHCLVPMDELFDAEELARWRAGTAGPSFASYDLGRPWALPMDAATQVAVRRPDLLPASEVPDTWPQVLELSGRRPVAVCLGGPHALLMFSSLCVAAGGEPALGPDGYVPRATGLAVLDLMARLLGRADRELAARNPIGVLEAMAREDGPAYCPLVYGYVTYQVPDGGRRALAAGDAPSWTPGGRRGSVLGGTGLAVSRRCQDLDGVRAHLRRLMSVPVQRELFPQAGGQPASEAAWRDPAVDARWGGFYGATRATLDAAWVRPRFAGWIPFQQRASALLRDGLLSGADHAGLLDRLDRAFLDAAGTALPAAPAPA